MKTLRSSDGKKVRRVSDEQAEKLVESGEWNYCPKKIWKAQVRDVVKSEPEKTEEGEK